MTAKEYLKQIARYDKRIRNKLAEKYYYESMIASGNLSGDRVQTSPKNDPIGNRVVKIAKLEKEIDRLVDRYVDLRTHIIEQIGALENEEYYDVLHAKFVRFLDFKDIPEEIGMSERKMYYIYDKALHEFERLFGSEFQNLQ